MECNRCLCLGYRYWLVAHGCRLTALPIVIDLLIFIMIHSVRAESHQRARASARWESGRETGV